MVISLVLQFLYPHLGNGVEKDNRRLAAAGLRATVLVVYADELIATAPHSPELIATRFSKEKSDCVSHWPSVYARRLVPS